MNRNQGIKGCLEYQCLDSRLKGREFIGDFSWGILNQVKGSLNRKERCIGVHALRRIQSTVDDDGIQRRQVIDLRLIDDGVDAKDDDIVSAVLVVGESDAIKRRKSNDAFTDRAVENQLVAQASRHRRSNTVIGESNVVVCGIDMVV